MAFRGKDTYDACRWWRVLFGDDSSGVALTERNARGVVHVK